MADKNTHHSQWLPQNMTPQNMTPQEYQQLYQLQWQWQMNQGVMQGAWQPAPYQLMMQQHVQQSFPNQAASQHHTQPKPSSTTSKDESPKVVKPKEVNNVTQSHTAAGIQSPKPNNPGFLLGAQRERGYHAFSPYSSRTGTPQAAYNELTVKTSRTPDETGIDLSVNKPVDERSDKTDQKPVGIAHARQRTNTDSAQKEGCQTSSSEQSTTNQTTASTTITTSTAASVTNSLSTPGHAGWQPTNMPPFMAPPYHHFTLNQQPSMPYMGLMHRAIFPGFQPNTPNNLPPYFVPQQLQNAMPELTVKTSQSNPLHNASTSPTKPKSDTNSPKSPLDKFREKCGQKRPDKPTDKSSPVQTAVNTPKTVKSTVIEKPSTHRRNKKQQSAESNLTAENQTLSEKSEKVSVIQQQRPKSKEKPNELVPPPEKPVEITRPEPVKRGANQTKRDAKPTAEKSAAKQPTPSPVVEAIPEPEPPADKPTRSNTVRQQNAGRAAANRQNYKPTNSEIKPRRGRKRVSSPPAVDQVDYSVEKQTQENVVEPEAQPAVKRETVKRRRTVSSNSGCELSPPMKATTSRRANKNQIKKSDSVDTEAENKEYLWKEDELEPIICKYNSNVYDICMDDDIDKLESALQSRLKLVNKRIESHQTGMLITDTAVVTESSEESPEKKTSIKNKESKFNVRSDSHPSMKIKAAAAAKRRKSDKSAANVKPLSVDVSRLHCRSLTQPELRTNSNLILICIEGLLYECRIKPIEPPDIYGIVIDGERNSKPRIFTEEDLLNHTYTNVTPREITDARVGTRLCCYWSDMIGCLYPGTVTEIIQDKTGSKNVKHLLDIEYDDGDSGRFPLSQTRLLPADYPHVKYDTSSVLAVGRRRRSAAVPDMPPIMISPPANRGRVSNYNQHSPNQTRKAAAVSPPHKSSPLDSSSSSTSIESSTSSTSDEDLPPPVKKPTVSTILWRWNGNPIKKESRGRGYKEFYQSIIRNGNVIEIGDCAVFKSNTHSKLPFIGKILSMWQNWAGKMMVSVKWFYHPQEIKIKLNLPKHKGALFESEHSDDNEIQTIKYKCSTLDYEQFISNKNHLLPSKPNTQQTTFYLAGKYDAARSKIQCLYV